MAKHEFVTKVTYDNGTTAYVAHDGWQIDDQNNVHFETGDDRGLVINRGHWVSLEDQP